jgi:hypothetical protein
MEIISLHNNGSLYKRNNYDYYKGLQFYIQSIIGKCVKFYICVRDMYSLCQVDPIALF